jgi:alkylation response protein AidB-like acyl-CoA dehydrogenase
MPSYTPPVRDTRFVLHELLRVSEGGHADADLVDTIVEEAGRFAAEVVAPLNRVADTEGCMRHLDGSVTTPPGFREAYRAYAESGWGTLALPENYGGQGLPHVLATVVEEYLNSACHAFNMYPGLTHGAVAALLAGGSDAVKDRYVAKLVSGEWLGTMALTEAQAGTDLGLVRTRAEPADDGGAYRITGEKIFCSGGEHDLTENIVHLVLARLPDAPEGTRGISLFVVPKVLPDGGRNAVSCGSIEHKMGIHGSATCVMNFDGATGWLVGEPNAGLAVMFVMMNAARLSCGNQGLAQAELAYQNAVAYVSERRQGRAPGSKHADALIVHPDVRRMLMDARAFTEGFRALVAWTALQIDLSHNAPGEDERASADALVGLLTPVLKAYGTDKGFETAVAMQQCFGGHGYVAEWGMEQIVRDARVAMIYEGANGVQALDLAGRKLVREGGEVCERFLALVEGTCEDADPALRWMSGPLREGVHEARDAACWLVSEGAADPASLGAGAYPFLQLIGTVAVGWMWLRMAEVSQGKDDAFHRAKLTTARHYAERTLPDCGALRRKVEAGGEALMALEPGQFART